MVRTKFLKAFKLSRIGLCVLFAITVIIALALQFRIHVANEWQQYAHLPSAKSPNKNDSVLVFAPHSDDETLGCGGILATAIENDAKAHVVLITNGDGYRIGVAKAYGTIRVTPEKCIQYAYKRQNETLRALQILGLPARCVTFLGYPDRGIAALWNRYWGADSLYLSKATHTNHSPYTNSFTLNAPYCGEGLIADIERIIRQVKPTDIYVPHPCDNHPDHYATYCFVIAAIEQLRSEGSEIAKRINIHTYLVHRGDWPIPKGDHPRQPLSPPQALAKADTKWYSLELNPKIIEKKRQAIKAYRTQTSLERGFLMSFARSNEIFGNPPVRSVACVTRGTITIDGDPEDWWGIPPAVVNPVGDYVIASMNKGGDVRAIYICEDDRSIYVRLDCVRRLSKRIAYNLSFRGLGVKDSDDRYTIVIKPPKRCDPPQTQWAYKDNRLELALPRRDFSPDDTLFVKVGTKLSKLTVDNTGWHGIEVSRGAD